MSTIRGTVIHGEGIGRQLGWPTANLDVDPEKTHLTDGIYAAYAYLQGKKYAAALVISRTRGKIEAYLIGYTGSDFYGEAIEVSAVQKIGQLEQYNSREELKEKIGKDMEIIKATLYEEGL